MLQGSGEADNKLILDLEDDAANANWGGSWRMPAEDEFKALFDNKGGVTSVSYSNECYTYKNLTFPIGAGDGLGSTPYGYPTDGSYWSTSVSTSEPNKSKYIGFRSSGKDSGTCQLDSYTRYGGFHVRPISD